MSRSGYNFDRDGDNWAHIRWAGALASTIRGRRGQAFLRELLAALDAMPEKRLIAKELVIDGMPDSARYAYFDPVPLPEDDIIVGGDVLVNGHGEIVRVGDVCALGCLGKARGLDMSNLDPEQAEYVAEDFGISETLVRHIVYINDESMYGPVTPERRWREVRTWVAKQIKGD